MIDNLDEESICQLKQILKRDLGDISEFSDEDIKNLGTRLLKVSATVLKRQMKLKEEVESPDLSLR